MATTLTPQGMNNPATINYMQGDGTGAVNPLNSPFYKQAQGLNTQDVQGQQAVQQTKNTGELDVSKQQGANQAGVQSLANQGQLANTQAGGDIQRALQSSQQAFQSGQHTEDISQAQWLQKAQETQAQRLQSGQLASNMDIAKLQSQTQLAPLDFAKEKFATVFPFLSQSFGQITGTGAGAGGGAGGPGGPGGGGFGPGGGVFGRDGGYGAANPPAGMQGNGTGVTPSYAGGGNAVGMGNWSGQMGGGPSNAGAPGFVYSPQDIQQQVNAAHAQNDQTTATNEAQMRSRLGGQGLGSNSPLAAALSGQLSGQNMATNSDSERQLRLAAAQANAGQATDAAKIGAGLQQAQIGAAGQLGAAGIGAGATLGSAQIGAGAQLGTAGINANVEQQRIKAGQFNAMLQALSGLA